MSRSMYLIHCYYTLYSFQLRIELALLANRWSPVLGDWCADQFGITAAYRRAVVLLGTLPFRGNAN
jgi:hypothetical protein